MHQGEESISDTEVGGIDGRLRGLGNLELAKRFRERTDTSFRLSFARGLGGSSHPGATLEFKLDAAIWTALGLLAATSLGSLFYLGSRIDGLGSRVDALGTRLDARIDSLDAKVDAGFSRIDTRLDAISTRLDAHLEQHAG